MWVEIATTIFSILGPSVLGAGEARHEARLKGFEALGKLEQALIEKDPGATPEFVKETVEQVLSHFRVGRDEIELYPHVYEVWTSPITAKAPEEAPVVVGEFLPKEVMNLIPWIVLLGLSIATVTLAIIKAK